MKYRISVLMSIYNCADTLVAALDSLYAQTYKDFKIILCEDGSKDDTYKVAEEYAKEHDNILLLRNPKNMGLNYSLNVCLAHADTEYCARMDGDDISLPHRFKEEIEFLDSHPEYDIVSGPMQYFDENGVFMTGHGKGEVTKMDFVKGSPFCHAPCMVRTEAYKAVGGYTVDKRLLRVEDYHMGFKMGAAICLIYRRLLHLAALAMFLPFIFYESTTINFLSEEWYRGTSRGMEISVIYLICGIIFLTLLFLRRVSRPFPDTGSLIYLVYLFWSLLSFWNADMSEYPYLAWCELWKMIMMHFVFWTIFSYLECTRNVETLLNGLGIVVIICFLIIVKDHYTGRYQARGFFPHQNSMAMFMGLLVPIYFSYYLNGRPESFDWKTYLVVLAFGSAALVRSYSRGAIFVFPVSLAVTVGMSAFRQFRLSLFTRLVPLVLVGALGLSLLIPRIIERYTKAPEISRRTRIELVQVALNMMKDKPFLGVGLNNWGIKVNPPYTYFEGTGRRTESDRNFETHKDGIVETIYMLVGAECGAVGLGLLLLWFGYYYVKAIMLCKKLADTEWFFLPAGLVGGLTAVYLQSVLEWVLKQSINFVTLIVCFAILAFLDKNWKRLKGKMNHKEVVEHGE